MTADQNEQTVVDRTPTDKEEQAFFSGEEKRSKQLQNDSTDQDIKERKRYADQAYGITQSWIGFLIVLTIAQLTLKSTGIGLSEPIFITVFTTTTASVLGFWILVGQYLFRKP